jgi:hypothetical protein
MISALAFVPPADVTEAFEVLCDHVPRELHPVMDYFEDNYIGRLTRRGVRRPPLFPIDLWNVFQRVQEGNARTTNVVEAWHRSIQTIIGEVHPSIWKLIKGLGRCQKLRDLEIEQLAAGHQPPRRRPAYENVNNRIENIVAHYPERNLLDYLRGISHNI